MCYPFEEGWANKVRSIDPNKVILSKDDRLRAILGRFREWKLFPDSSPGGIRYSRIRNCDVYFYFHWDRPQPAYQGNAYIGFIVPKIYEEVHGDEAMRQGKPRHSKTSRTLRPVELVLSVASQYRFTPNTDDLDSYSGGPYRKIYIPGAGEDEMWIVEFQEDWNCKDVWWEKTKAIRAINTPNCSLCLNENLSR